ncbi:ubiquitin-like modifier-activating enzyme 1 [Homarus americanus]|uniref:ubiquitin-like modifier-activating enzyme 1 n=1 Tax=Homarus americanus TaxID=6706 RepID=UPI001C45846C|nr:ubiquitin-like modifier-activating enzyme 1 [Homarus americanus]
MADGSGSPGQRSEVTVIDEALYSRQLYVLGHQAMTRMGHSHVLVCGLGGLGVEVAKNVILGGVKSVTLHDTKSVTQHDLSTQYYLCPSDLGTNRALASRSRLAELNDLVVVSASVSPLSQEYLASFNVVVLTDYDLDEQLKVCGWCREVGAAFVSTSTRGVFGQLFCDFGSCFTVVDEDGKEPVSLGVVDVTREARGVVTCLVKRRLGLRDGDLVTFSGLKGMTQLNGCPPTTVKVLGPSTFSIGDTRSFSEYEGGGVAAQAKVPKTVSFKSLKESLAAPVFVVTDELKCERSELLHIAFQALHEYVRVEGSLPRPWDDQDADKFLKVFHVVNGVSPAKVEDVDENIVRTFSKVSSGDVAPMNSVMGSVASQEVIKACSGKFSPVYQWLYFDAVECLPGNASHLSPGDFSPRGSRYDAQVAVLGRQLQDRLGSFKVFVVGAGAIGCELLKNLAMIGVGSAEGGGITLTDMDHIEKSNLNRQFLFRSWDIKKSKSVTAAAAIKKMNPDVNITAHQVRVGPESEHVYNADFYESLDVVTNALDNVEARRYMDRRCWYYRKPMLESGTLGTRGSVQVVLPHVTDRFRAGQGSREEGVPLCTLRSFPNCIEHTLQWARDLFEGEFCQSPETARQYLQEEDFIARSSNLPDPDYRATLAVLKSKLVDDAPHSFSDCVSWARRHWETNFHNQIVQLLEYFPSSYRTNTGDLFWSGSKRCPHPLHFDVSNSLHLDYVVSAANLLAQVYGIPQCKDRSQVAQLVATVKVPPYVPEARSEADDEDAETNILSVHMREKSLTNLQDAITPREGLHNLTLTPLTFDKDDDENHHIDFIVATSNLRALNYDIEPADRHKSKGIAGRIIPAIATSTALVAGLVSLELIKVAQGHTDIESYKNMSFNLALPLLILSVPDPPPVYQYNEVKWTTWDSFEVEGEVTMKQFLDYFRVHHGLEVNLVASGDLTLYSDLFSDTQRSKIMTQTVTEILLEVSDGGSSTPMNRTLMLDIGASDKSGEIVAVPHVRYTVHRA